MQPQQPTQPNGVPPQPESTPPQQPEQPAPFSQPSEPFSAQPSVPQSEPITTPPAAPSFQAADTPFPPSAPTASPQQPLGQAPTIPPAPDYTPHTAGMGQPQMPHHAPDNKKLFIIGGIVAGVLVVGAAAYFLLGNNNPIANVVNSVTGTPDVMDRSDNTLDLSNLIPDVDNTIKNQDVKAKLKQQVNLSNGMSYMVTGVTRGYAPTSRFLKASSGKEFIKVDVVIGDRSKDETIFASVAVFKFKNSAGGLQDAEYVSESDMPGALKGQEVDPGKQITGSVLFEVDKDEQGSLVTSDKYEKLGTKEQAVVASEVALK